jgi:protein-disulfide isomerase
MRLKPWHAYLALGILIGFGAGFLAGRAGRSPAAVAAPPADGFGAEIAGRAFRGPADAPVTIVEFTDYQCVFCRRHVETTYPALLAHYGDDIKYVVRHFPISEAHPRAAQAAEAAECAGDQGRFFEYHETLFRYSRELSDENLVSYARGLGLDVAGFQRCLDSGRKAGIVEQDIQDGLVRGVMGTPTFFINGKIMFGAQPEDIFRRVIDRALADR